MPGHRPRWQRWQRPVEEGVGLRSRRCGRDCPRLGPGAEVVDRGDVPRSRGTTTDTPVPQRAVIVQ